MYPISQKTYQMPHNAVFKAAVTTMPSQQTLPGVQIPDIYYIPEQTKKKQKGALDILRMVDIFDIVMPWIEYPLVMAPVTAGLVWGVGKMIDANGGEYSKSIMGRAENFGNKIEKSKIVQSKPAQETIRFLKKLLKRTDKTLEKSDLYWAAKHTPAEPQWSIAKQEMLNMGQRVEQDFLELAGKLRLADVKPMSDGLDINPEELIRLGIKLDDGSPRLQDIGIDKAERDLLKKHYNVKDIFKIPDDKQTEAVNRILLKRHLSSDAEVEKILATGQKAATEKAKELQLKTLGLTVEDLAKIQEDKTGEYVKKVLEATKKAGNKVRISRNMYGFLGNAQILESKLGCDAIYNRLKGIVEYETKTGSFMSKAVQSIQRMLTFGGAKVTVVAFIASIFARNAIAAHKADPDKKVATFNNNMVDHLGWVLTFPLGAKVIYSLIGMKYAGLSEDNVKAIRKETETFNERVRNGEFRNDKAKYKDELKKLKERLKPLKKVEKPQSLFTRIGKGIANWLSKDLEMPYFNHYAHFADKTIEVTFKDKVAHFFKNLLPTFWKNVLRVPTRAVLFFILAEGLFGGILKKCARLIFGKEQDVEKQDEHKELKEKQKEFTISDLNQRLYETQARKNGILPTSTAKESNPTFHGKSREQISAPLNHRNPIDNYTYIPSQDSVIEQPKEEVVNKYIPSQMPAKFEKSFDNSGLEAALRRADKAEQKAIRTLSGKFQ